MTHLKTKTLLTIKNGQPNLSHKFKIKQKETSGREK